MYRARKKEQQPATDMETVASSDAKARKAAYAKMYRARKKEQQSASEMETAQSNMIRINDNNTKIEMETTESNMVRINDHINTTDLGTEQLQQHPCTSNVTSKRELDAKARKAAYAISVITDPY